MSFLRIDEQRELEPIPGYKGRFIHTENMSIAFWHIEAGAVAPEHSHPHEQVVCPLEGRFEITVWGETRTLESGDVVVIAPNVVHSGRAISDCRIIDTFYPVRDDYRQTTT
jgi:quercetin dioxygenase-like cupin family protein